MMRALSTIAAILFLLPCFGASPEGRPTVSVDTIADLVARNPVPNERVLLSGFRSAGDFGMQRILRHDPLSVAATNPGCVYANAGSGRYLAEDCESGEVDARWFGWTGTNTVSDMAALTSAAAVAQENRSLLVYPDGGPLSADKTAVFIGDSVVEGASATTANQTWWKMVSSRYGWGAANLAFGGALASDLPYQAFPGYSHRNGWTGVTNYSTAATSTNLQVFLKVGINDGADFPTTHPQHEDYLTHFERTILGVAAYYGTPSKVLAAAMTQGGTWSAYTGGPTSGFGGAMGLQSTNSGDTLTFSTMGDAVYLAYLVGVSNYTTLGKLIVQVDGATQETIEPNGVGFGNREQLYGIDISYIPFSVTNGVWLSRYSGLGQRQHTVVVTATNNSTTLPSVVLWGAGSQQPYGIRSGPNIWLLENLNRAADSTRDATYSALRARLQNVSDALTLDGLHVGVIKPNSYYSISTGISGDGIHPNDTGMVQVANAVVETLERYSTAGSKRTSLDARNGVSKSGGFVELGGSLTKNTTITGGSYDLDVLGTVKATATGSDFAVWARTDGSFPVMVDALVTPIVMMRKVRTSLDSPTAVIAGDRIGRLSWTPNGGGGLYQNSAWIDAFASETHGSGVAGSYMQFAVTTNGSATGVVVLDLKPNMATFTTPTTLFPQVDGDDFSLWIKSTNSFPMIVDSLGNPQIYMRKLRGSFDSPTAVQTGDTLGALIFNGNGGGGVYQNSAYIRSKASENHSLGASGGYLDFAVTPTGTNAQITTLQLFYNNASFTTPVTVTSTGVGATIDAAGTGIALNGDNAFGIIANRNSDSGPKEFAIQRSRAGATAVQAGDTIGILGFFAHNGTTYPGRNAGIVVGASETHTTTNSGTSIILSATPPGSNAPINSAVFRGINNDLYRQTRVADTGLEGNPDPSAALEVLSVGRGFLPPRMTTAQRLAIAAPATGLLVYDTNLLSMLYYDGEWRTLWSSVNDGAGSGLDADLLDGNHAGAFAASSHTHSGGDINSGTVDASYIDTDIARTNQVFSLVTAQDGTGSNLDADLLDGNDSSAFAGAGHDHDGTYLPLTGGTVTGLITVTNEPTLAGIKMWNNPVYFYDSDTPTEWGKVIYSEEGYLQIESTVGGIQIYGSAVTLPLIPPETASSTNELQILVVSTNSVATVNEVNRVARMTTNEVRTLLGVPFGIPNAPTNNGAYVLFVTNGVASWIAHP